MKISKYRLFVRSWKKIFSTSLIFAFLFFGLGFPIEEAKARLIFTTEDDGVNADVYHLDQDDTSVDFIDLEFGSTIGARLRYDVTEDKFILNRALDLDGNEITNFRIENSTSETIAGITGTTNIATNPRLVSVSADISTEIQVDDYVKLATGVGGSYIRYRVVSITTSPNQFTVDQDIVSDITNGNILKLGDDAPECTAGSEGRMIYDTDMNKMLFCDGTDWVDPADAIQPGAITSTEIKDETITLEDIAPRNATETITPEFQNFSIYADGSNNVGTLEADFDNITNRNFYKWTTKKNGLNDYDIILQWPVPENFQGWADTNQILVDYKTDTTSSSDNVLDIALLDTVGSPVSLTGGSSLVSTTNETWEDDSNISFTSGSGSGLFTPGEYMTLQFKMQSNNSNSSYIGPIKLNYIVK